METTQDSVENFSSVVASQDCDSFFGLAMDLESRTTRYVGFRGNFDPFETAYGHSKAIYAGESRIAFFDYYSFVFGLVDAREGRIVWERSISSSANLACMWADARDGILRVQLKQCITSFDIRTGREVDVAQIKGTLKAAGPDYSIVANGKAVAVRTRGGELRFKSANGIGTVRRFEQHLATIECQGPARVIAMETGSIVFEAVPEPGSQFSQLHYTDGGPIVLTQHFFDQPILTDIRIYENMLLQKDGMMQQSQGPATTQSFPTEERSPSPRDRCMIPGPVGRSAIFEIQRLSGPSITATSHTEIRSSSMPDWQPDACSANDTTPRASGSRGIRADENELIIVDI